MIGALGVGAAMMEEDSGVGGKVGWPDRREVFWSGGEKDIEYQISDPSHQY